MLPNQHSPERGVLLFWRHHPEIEPSWAHSLNDTQPQKGSFCAAPRQKCSKDYFNVFLKNSSSFSALFSLSGIKISSFEALLGFTAVREQKTGDGDPSSVFQ
jgi:hypothetical protein